MGYSFIRWNGNGKFLKSVPGGYKIVHFQHLKDSFTTYLREDFDSSLLPEGIYYEDLMNKYYQSNPITGLYARSYFLVEHKLNESDFILDGELLKYK